MGSVLRVHPLMYSPFKMQRRPSKLSKALKGAMQVGGGLLNLSPCLGNLLFVILLVTLMVSLVEVLFKI